MNQETKKPESVTTSHYIIGAAVVGIMFYLATGGNDDKAPAAGSQAAQTVAQPAVENVQPQKEIYQTTSRRLFSDYDKNEVAVDEKIKDKQVILLGVIESIDKDFMDNMIVNLVTSNQFMPSRMHMVESEKPVVLEKNKGDKVAITCEKISRVMGSPSGSDCVFTNPVQPLPDYR